MSVRTELHEYDTLCVFLGQCDRHQPHPHSGLLLLVVSTNSAPPPPPPLLLLLWCEAVVILHVDVTLLYLLH